MLGVTVTLMVDRDEARSLQVGERVATAFSRRITLHTVRERQEGAVSQSGVLVRVDPPVPTSGGADAWLDVGWFQRVKP